MAARKVKRRSGAVPDMQMKVDAGPGPEQGAFFEALEDVRENVKLDGADSLTILQLVAEAYVTAFNKGWWPREENRNDVNVIAAKLALIHSEVSEALEALRNEGPVFLNMYVEDGKPEGFVSELADVVIRIGDLCGALELDLGEAIKAKLMFNRTRPHRHGGKAL